MLLNHVSLTATIRGAYVSTTTLNSFNLFSKEVAFKYIHFKESRLSRSDGTAAERLLLSESDELISTDTISKGRVCWETSVCFISLFSQLVV